MKDIIRTKSYWIVSILAAGVIFAALLNLNETYKSEVDVLVLPKNTETLSNADQIIANAEEIPLSLSFYNKLLESNSGINDISSGKSDPEKKKIWNDKVKVERISGSEVVKIEASDKNRFQAEIISQQTALDLTQILNRYYNPETDLETRVISGPIIREAGKYNPGIVFAASLLIALLAVYFSFGLSSLAEKMIPRRSKKPSLEIHFVDGTRVFPKKQSETKKDNVKVKIKIPTSQEARKRLDDLLLGKSNVF